MMAQQGEQPSTSGRDQLAAKLSPRKRSSTTFDELDAMAQRIRSSSLPVDEKQRQMGLVYSRRKRLKMQQKLHFLANERDEITRQIDQLRNENQELQSLLVNRLTVRAAQEQVDKALNVRRERMHSRGLAEVLRSQLHEQSTLSPGHPARPQASIAPPFQAPLVSTPLTPQAACNSDHMPMSLEKIILKSFLESQAMRGQVTSNRLSGVGIDLAPSTDYLRTLLDGHEPSSVSRVGQTDSSFLLDSLRVPSSNMSGNNLATAVSLHGSAAAAFTGAALLERIRRREASLRLGR